LWDLRNRSESAVLTTNFWIRPNNIVFSPDSKRLAFVDNYKGVFLWNLTTQREITHMKAYFPFSGTLGMAFSPDSRTLAYADGEEGDIVLWDVHAGAGKGLLKGHSNELQSLAFAPDGQTLASSSVDKTAKLWRLSEGFEQG